jgi:hypothetical protein
MEALIMKILLKTFFILPDQSPMAKIRYFLYFSFLFIVVLLDFRHRQLLTPCNLQLIYYYYDSKQKQDSKLYRFWQRVITLWRCGVIGIRIFNAIIGRHLIPCWNVRFQGCILHALLSLLDRLYVLLWPFDWPLGTHPQLIKWFLAPFFTV